MTFRKKNSTEFQNMNNSIKLGALGFNFGTLNAFKANTMRASIRGPRILRLLQISLIGIEAPIPGLPKKSKASKELKRKNDLIGELLSISGWTKFLRRLDALDAHFRDRVSEYDKIRKKSKGSKDSQTLANIFDGLLKP